jgi:hypothetical protein
MAPSPSCEEFFELADLVQQVSLIKVPKEAKQKVLYYCAFAGVFKALHFGFLDTLISLKDYIDLLAGEDTDIKVFSLFMDSLNEQLERAEKTVPLTEVSINFVANAKNVKHRFECFKTAFATY